MGFFKREPHDQSGLPSPPPADTRRSTIGVVIDATAPAQNPQALILRQTIVADTGAGPTRLFPQIRVSRDFWLVRGMTVTLEFATPGAQEVEVINDFPSIDDRIAAGDSILVDPRAAVRAARVASADAYAKQREELGVAPYEGPDPGAAQHDGFDQALARAAQAPVVDGWTPAVVIIVSRREWYTDHGYHGASDWMPHPSKTERAGADTILSVNVPGVPPYAILIELLKLPKEKQHDLPWLPAFVCSTARNEIRIDWENVPDRFWLREQEAADREQVAKALGEHDQALQERLAPQRVAGPIDPATATYQQVAHQQITMAASMPPAQRDAFLANIKVALSRTAAPAHDAYRDALRAEGLDVSEVAAQNPGSVGRLSTTDRSASPSDPLERLAKLSDLHDRGALTDAEFAAEKAKILDER